MLERCGDSFLVPQLRRQVTVCQRCSFAETREQPELGRGELDAGTVRQALVHLPSVLASGKRRQSALELLQSVVVTRSVKAVPDIGGLRGRSQRYLDEEPRQQKREH